MRNETVTVVVMLLSAAVAAVADSDGAMRDCDDDPTITVLAERLTGGDEDVRLYDLEEELLGLRLRPLVPVLLDLLESDDGLGPEEVKLLCRILGTTGDPRAADALARMAVESGSMELQRTAAWNVGLLPGGIVEDYLMASLAGESEDHARGAAWALATLRAERALEPLKAMMLREGGSPSPAIGFAISRIQGPSSRPFLIERLSSPNAKTREAAAYGLLWRSNYEAVGALAERLLEDDEYRVRMQGAQSLGIIGGAEAAEALEQALEDPSPDVRNAAANALAEIDGRHKSPARLIAALGGADDAVRGAVVSALANVEGDGVTGALVQVLRDDPHTYPRFAAARALGQHGDPEAVPPLVEALQDDQRLVRTEAAEALGKLGKAAAVETLAGALEDLPYRASEALGRIGGPGAIEALIEALGNGNYSAIDALGEIGAPRAVPVLLDHLDRSGTGEAIGKCGDEWVTAELLARMENPAGEELRQAAIALGYIGGERAVRGLIPVSRSRMVALRKPAIQALGRTREPAALDAVVFALENDPRQIVRLVAAEAVRRIGGEQALPMLLEKLRDESFCVREGAAWGLGHLGDPAAVDALIEALGDEHGLVRIAAARALGKLGDSRAVEPLRRMLWDAHATATASEALEQIEQQ